MPVNQKATRFFESFSLPLLLRPCLLLRPNPSPSQVFHMITLFGTFVSPLHTTLLSPTPLSASLLVSSAQCPSLLPLLFPSPAALPCSPHRHRPPALSPSAHHLLLLTYPTYPTPSPSRLLVALHD
eukprot:1980783-Pleurochrysis_carterae.AAC.2